MIMEAGEILRKRGLLTEDQLTASRRSDAQNIVTSAVSLGYVNEGEALSALADELGLDFIDLREADIDLKTLSGFPQKLIYRHSLFPIRIVDGALLVATSDPLDLYPLDEASAATGMTIIPVVAEQTEIARLVKRHLGVGSETVEGLYGCGRRRRRNPVARWFRNRRQRAVGNGPRSLGHPTSQRNSAGSD